METKTVRPPKVNSYDYWTNPPPQPSDRLVYWLDRIEHGWKRNKFMRGMGYDEAAHYYGIYIWEYCNVLFPKFWETEHHK